MTKHTFDYERLCDILYLTNPADFKKELERLNLPKKKLRSLLTRHAQEQRDRLKEIEVESQELAADRDQASAHLAAVSVLLS